ncbi:Asp domain protein [Ceratobasidium sp. AG-Ba]|nr:Asp domain protein [Ceratobasidium sp. AG-Ba]
MITVSRTLDLPPPYVRAAPAYSPMTNSAASSLFSTDSCDNNVYEYSSKNTVLRFSQCKRTSVRLPAYGRGGIVDGEISLRSTNHVESIIISLKGEIKTTIETSTRPTLTSKTILIDQPCVAWPLPQEPNASVPHIVPFSFVFPDTIKGRGGPLPPSFIGSSAEGSIRVKYTVVAHVRRTGWRGNTTVESEVFYLPRPTERTPHQGSTSIETTSGPVESLYDTSVVELPVKQSTAGKQVASEVKAHLACPRAITFSEGSPVHFGIYLSSQTQPVERILQLASHISVRLVRSVTLTAKGQSSIEDTVCAHGALRVPELSSKTEGQYLIFMMGSLQPTSTTWTSWEVEGVSKITYALRVTLPTSFQPQLAYLDHTIPVLGLSGSYGSSSSPDLSLVPTPAALLKKPIGYMPMRV